MKYRNYFGGLAIIVAALTASAKGAIFMDNFEAGTAGAAPGPAQVGVWNTLAAEYGLITTAHAYDGTKSLLISRVAQANPRAFGNLFPYFNPGATVYARFHIYAVSGIPDFGLADNSNTGLDAESPVLFIRTAGFPTAGPPALTHAQSGTSEVTTGLVPVLNQWQTYEILYTVGALTATVTLDGVAATINAPFYDGQASTTLITGLHFSTGQGGTEYYVDDIFLGPVPEPTGGVAMTFAMGLTLLRPRRQSGSAALACDPVMDKPTPS